jgi:two-component system cell cycle response regulator DivK
LAPLLLGSSTLGKERRNILGKERLKLKMAEDRRSGHTHGIRIDAMKILIVDDYEDCREIIAVILKTAGFTVIEASTGEESVEKAMSEQRDLIIMDLSLPGINGLEATSQLKLEPLTARIPIVAFTAWHENEYRRKATSVGVARFLTKPIAYTHLLEVIRQFPRIDEPR